MFPVPPPRLLLTFTSGVSQAFVPRVLQLGGDQDRAGPAPVAQAQGRGAGRAWPGRQRRYSGTEGGQESTWGEGLGRPT